MAKDKKPQSEASKFLTVLVIFGVLGALCFGGGGSDDGSPPTTSGREVLETTAKILVDNMSPEARATFCRRLAETYQQANGDADVAFEISFEDFEASYTRSSPPAILVYQELGERC